jgi:ectoine hydroxylase-related dioxygenase (phytanoyl-CoA dioxygenase family)
LAALLATTFKFITNVIRGKIVDTNISLKQLRSVPRTATINQIMQIVNEDGGVIVREIITKNQAQSFNDEIQPHLELLDAGSKHAEEFVKEFHGSNTKRLTDLVNRSPTFRNEIIDNDVIHAMVEAALLPTADTFWMTTAQVIEIGPRNKAQMLHRDLENYSPFLAMGKDGPEVACNCILALNDFTEDNGATRVIPGSNHWDDFSDRGQPEDTVPALLTAGDALFFSGKVAHGGGANITDNQYRRAVTMAFNTGWLVPEEAYPFLISLDTARTLSKRVQRMLGFRSHQNASHGGPGLWQRDYEELADYLKL